jgi:hypothetical protein
VRHRRGRDRRELQIVLTDAGTQLLDAVRRRTVSEWAQAVVGVCDDDRHYVARVLAEITAVGVGSVVADARGLSA